MRGTTLIAFVISLLFLAGCNKTAPTNAPQATVTLSDGTTFSGAVTASSPSSITLQSSTGDTRTYPMTQVSAVQYAQAQPAQTAANQATTAPPPPNSAAPAPAPANSAYTPPPPPVSGA